MKNDQFAREDPGPAYNTRYLYTHTPIADQVKFWRKKVPALANCFVNLNDRQLPRRAEGHFAIPRWQMFGSTYLEAVRQILDMLNGAYYGRLGMVPNDLFEAGELRQSAAAEAGWEKIYAEQKSDILIIPAQFGGLRPRRSIRLVRKMLSQNEFGLGVFAVAAMLLTHPDRLRHHLDLYVDCPGDEYRESRKPRKRFDHTLTFYFLGDELHLQSFYIYLWSFGGSATGWTEAK